MLTTWNHLKRNAQNAASSSHRAKFNTVTVTMFTQDIFARSAVMVIGIDAVLVVIRGIRVTLMRLIYFGFIISPSVISPSIIYNHKKREDTHMSSLISILSENAYLSILYIYYYLFTLWYITITRWNVIHLYHIHIIWQALFGNLVFVNKKTPHSFEWGDSVLWGLLFEGDSINVSVYQFSWKTSTCYHLYLKQWR